MKSSTVTPISVTIVMFVAIQALMWLPVKMDRFSAPYISAGGQSEYCDGLEPGSMMLIQCSCPDINVTAVGFPFRTNKYDYCSVKNDSEVTPVIANYVLTMGFLGLAFAGTRKLVRKLA